MEKYVIHEKVLRDYCRVFIRKQHSAFSVQKAFWRAENLMAEHRPLISGRPYVPKELI